MVQRAAVATGLFLAAALAGAAEPEAGLKDFLVDASGSYVGAAGIIGLDGQVVRDVATPKEFVASVNTLRRSDSKDGVGIAFSPGRSRFERAVINLRAVESDKATSDLLKGLWRRVLGSTTISYAQKRGAINGTGDYRHWAYAINTEYYWNLRDDPTVAAFRVFNEGAECVMARTAVGADSSKLAEALKQVRLSVTESSLAQVRAEAAAAAASAAASAAAKSNPAESPARKEAEANAQKRASEEALAKANKGDADMLERQLKACVKAASQEAVSKWNAPKATLLVGSGRIQGTGASDPRYSLGNHVQLGISVSPAVMLGGGAADAPNSQLTIAYKRTSRALDTTTLATTPAYKSLSLAALRYTYAFGRSDEGLTSYLLAEVSNVKKQDGPVAAGTFKYAVGWDYKLGANMWLELRSGRSVARTGDKEETKSLLALKFASEPTLSSLVASK